MAGFCIIIQPKAGVKYEDVIAARAEAAQALMQRELQPMDTLSVATKYTDDIMDRMGIASRECFAMSELLRMMSMCRAAYVCRGWKKDPESARLKAAAEWFGLEIIEADNAAR